MTRHAKTMPVWPNSYTRALLALSGIIATDRCWTDVLFQGFISKSVAWAWSTFTTFFLYVTVDDMWIVGGFIGWAYVNSIVGLVNIDSIS